MARQKVVNGVYIDLTAEEEAELAARAEAGDLDLSRVRSERDGQLRGTDWTQLGDAALGDHTAEDWQAYRQDLRDVPQTYSRVSEVVWPTPPE
jgi:Flp pilus assembly protein CpaB